MAAASPAVLEQLQWVTIFTEAAKDTEKVKRRKGHSFSELLTH